MNSTELTQYLNNGVDNIIERIIKGSIFNLKEMFFLSKVKTAFEKANEKRLASEKKGTHIPAFLISSITQNCNLFCKGCYARANKTCDNQGSSAILSESEWSVIFREASDLGISFNLLAGGEPLLRKDVLQAAAEIKEMIFPIFTNGTLIDGTYIKFFDENRNMIPIISIEGKEATTDERRGEGTYQKIISTMESMKKKKLVFGASVTVSKANLQESTSEEFIESLGILGCKAVLFIEYVPVDRSTEPLAFDEEDRIILEAKQNKLNDRFKRMLFVSFPGDEKYMGGCLAAGRGFFHINADGAAEACPFSPYSDRNIKDGGLLAALQSPLFEKIKESNLNNTDHTGGCTLFKQEEMIKELILK